MLSRVAKASLSFNKPSLLYRCVASSASSQAAAAATPAAAGGHKKHPHDAPERDFVNFPPPRIPLEGGKIRIGLVPDEWFKAMYDKTGVTGPYILFWGGIATLFSKEYFVYWADTMEQLVFLGLVVYVSKKFGKTIAGYLEKEGEKKNAELLDDLINKPLKAIDVKVKENEALQALPEANKIIHAAKKENVQLQMEFEYRHRLNQIYQEVKRRLDFQVASQNVFKRVEKEQALNYILSNVNSSIGANQEKEAFQSGLAQLKALSQKHAGTI